MQTYGRPYFSPSVYQRERMPLGYAGQRGTYPSSTFGSTGDSIQEVLPRRETCMAIWELFPAAHLAPYTCKGRGLNRQAIAL